MLQSGITGESSTAKSFYFFQKVSVSPQRTLFLERKLATRAWKNPGEWWIIFSQIRKTYRKKSRAIKKSFILFSKVRKTSRKPLLHPKYRLQSFSYNPSILSLFNPSEQLCFLKLGKILLWKRSANLNYETVVKSTKTSAFCSQNNTFLKAWN